MNGKDYSMDSKDYSMMQSCNNACSELKRTACKGKQGRGCCVPDAEGKRGGGKGQLKYIIEKYNFYCISK